METIDIEIYSDKLRRRIAVNNALLKHGIKATIRDVNDELDQLSMPETTVENIIEVIADNLYQTKEFVSYDLAQDYLELAICFSALRNKHSVAYLHYLASEENTNDEFIKIENEILIPLGGTTVDYKEYKKASQKIIEHIK